MHYLIVLVQAIFYSLFSTHHTSDLARLLQIMNTLHYSTKGLLEDVLCPQNAAI